METYHLILVNIETGKRESVDLFVHEEDAIVLQVVFQGNEIVYADDGYFQAFQKIRDYFLGLGYGIQCQGANINAIQSAMYARTDLVYLATPGKQAFQKDLVSMWMYADIDVFPDTEQQNEFFEYWIQSLRGE